MAGPLAIGTRVLVAASSPGAFAGYAIISGDDGVSRYLVIGGTGSVGWLVQYITLMLNPPGGVALLIARILSAITIATYVPYGSALATPWTPQNVIIPGGAPTGATGTSTVSGGAVTGVTVTSGGTDYGVMGQGANYGLIGSALPTVCFLGNGLGATAVANVVNGVVTSVTVTNGGSGYTSPPIVAFC